MDVVFRNDDVSVETDLKNFKEFCGIFARYGSRNCMALPLTDLRIRMSEILENSKYTLACKP